MKKLSRTRIQNFLDCPRCFYLEENINLKRTSMPPFLINSAVDALLKKEFDHYRALQQPHPYMEEIGLNAIPAQHELLDQWRHVFTGVQYQLPDKDYLLFGGIDDLWINDQKEFIVVDYKATAKKDPPTIGGKWGKKYKNQIEFYQWLLRNNGETVSDDTYFVYCNGQRNLESFNNRVEFKAEVILYVGDDSWVEETVYKAIETLESNQLPDSGSECEHCNYVRRREDAESQF